jgi:lipopolysaccharide biosynthesis glycosyltransferase
LNEEIKPLRIFIGWDSREDIAYQVCKQSILDTASVPVEIVPLKQKDLIRKGLYSRPTDTLASTEFTFTRLLLPELCNFQGWALFIDCDVVLKTDIKELFDQVDDQYAVMCAQHDYTPKEGTKMDGKQQLPYPRKNWSSMMLVNCGHTSNKIVTKEFVNDPEKTGAFLHRFSWLHDSELGKISHTWNWLVGWYSQPTNGIPDLIHYTNGGPWFEEYQDCEYAVDWYKAHINFLKTNINVLETRMTANEERVIGISDLTLSDQKKNLIELFLQSTIDPDEVAYKTKKQLHDLKDIEMGVKVVAISPSKGDFNTAKKGHLYDPYLRDFVLGSGGTISEWNKINPSGESTLVIRGLGSTSQTALRYCLENKRNFYAIDTGYLQPGTKKQYHRVSFNGLQNTNPLVARDNSRLDKLNFKPGKFKTGRKILLVPPSEKVMMFYGKDLDEWMSETITEIKKHTDRPIEIRLKPNRTDRVTSNPIWQAMQDDVHCLVTFNSIAATEAFLFGLPAIALAPNAATSVCNTSIDQIENLTTPAIDLQIPLARHLSYCQFTSSELANGTAWHILNEGS